MPDTKQTKEVFVSYSHVNTTHRKDFQKFMAPLAADGTVKLWDDTQIPPGADWLAEIEAAMGRAGVAVMLVSADFLASRFCTEVELAGFVKAQEERGLKVVGVLVSDCLWQRVPYLAERQMLPKDANNNLKPVDQFDNRSKAWTSVAKAIAGLLKP